MVKLRVYVVIWCFGFVLGEKVIIKKMKATSCHAGKKILNWYINVLWLSLLTDVIEPVLGTCKFVNVPVVHCLYLSELFFFDIICKTFACFVLSHCSAGKPDT